MATGNVKWFDDLDDLYLAIDVGMIDVLQSVIPVAEDILRKHIRKSVYISSEPHPNKWVNGETYQRRHTLEDSVETIWEGDHEIVITSTADANASIIPGYHFVSSYPGGFLQLLESGHMGFLNAGAHGFPRPAVTNAQMEVNSSSKINAAVEKGLRKAGMK